MKIDINLDYAPSDLKEIYSVVCQMYAIDIREKSRKQSYVFARAIFFSLSRKLTKHSHVLIASFVNQGHCSSMHGVRTFDNLMATSKEFREAARFALFKSCGLLEKIEEDPRDFIFLNWSEITNKQQMKIKEKMAKYLFTNKSLLKKESYA